MTDDEANQHYADPENRKPAGRGRRLTPASKSSLSTHVPIRFRPETIAQVKILAREDGLSVSSWIRRVVERTVAARMPNWNTTTSVGAPGGKNVLGGASQTSTRVPSPA